MLQWLGILMRHVFTNVHKGYHRILLDHGISQAMLDEWSARADEGKALPVDLSYCPV